MREKATLGFRVEGIDEGMNHLELKKCMGH